MGEPGDSPVCPMKKRTKWLSEIHEGWTQPREIDFGQIKAVFANRYSNTRGCEFLSLEMIGKDSGVESGGRHTIRLTSYWGFINPYLHGIGKILVVKGSRSFKLLMEVLQWFLVKESGKQRCLGKTLGFLSLLPPQPGLHMLFIFCFYLRM